MHDKTFTIHPVPSDPNETQSNIDSLKSQANNSRAPAGYELLEVIGRGGMGEVYRARDLRLHRDVAVKLLQDRYAAGSSVAQRFVEEATITGQLQHPGIPAVHELGTLPDGRPFLAMKLIKGNTLDGLLKTRPDPSHERGKFLAAFEAICQAVGYAHVHGVIHRDLKPANVMVGSFGEVQVMDWGLAKVLTPPVIDAALKHIMTTEPGTAIRSIRGEDQETQAGSLLGTPAFMPPEQAVGAIDQIDTRSDVFGLGAILCVILTGLPPYVGQDVESTRQLAARGKLDEAHDRLDICGAEPELITLCKSCLSVEKAKRPENAVGVAQAVQQLRSAAEERARQAELEQERAAIRTAEVRKRWRILSWSASGIALTLAIGMALSIMQWMRAVDAEAEKDIQLRKTQIAETEARTAQVKERRAAELAQQREQEAKESEAKAIEREQQEIKARISAETIAKYMQEIFSLGSAHGQSAKLNWVNPKLTLLEAIDYATDNIDGRFPDRPDIEAEVRNTIGKTYHEFGVYSKALPHYQRALELRRQLFGNEHPATLNSLNNLAHLYHMIGKYDLAEPLSIEAQAGRRKVLGDNHPDTLTSINNLALLYKFMNRYDDAEPLFREVLTDKRKVLGSEHPSTLATVGNLASLYDAMDRHQEAETLFLEALAGFRKKYGDQHPDTIVSLGDLAGLYESMGRYQEAEPLYQKALSVSRKTLGDLHPDTIGNVNNLAFLYKSWGRFAEAEPLYREAVTGCRKTLGGDHPNTLLSINNLAVLYYEMKRYDQALLLFREVITAYEKRADGAFLALLTRSYLGMALLENGKPSEAEPHLLAWCQGLSKLPTLSDKNHNRLRWAMAGLIQAYEQTNKPDLAKSWRSRLAQLAPEIAPPPRKVNR